MSTAPEVIRLAEATADRPLHYYNKATSEVDQDEASLRLLAPRTKRQVRTAKARLRLATKAGGQFENLNALAMDYPDIRLLTMQAGIIVVIVNPIMQEQAKEILSIDYNTARF